MIPRGGPPGPRRRGSAALVLLLFAASVWLYGALLVFYPEAFRRHYSEEMRRDFRELMLEGLEEGGAIEMVMGLRLCVGLVVDRPSLAASIARKLGVPADLQVVGQAGIPAVLSAGPSEADVIKEKELLGALDRRGKLTAAAFETSLSVEEAEQMLDALAVKGHPEDTVEHGRLVYAHREHEV